MARQTTGSKERIVDATLTLLRRGGISAAGLNQVVELAQAPKGSLYHYFPSGKSEMVSVALESYRLQVAQEHKSCLCARSGIRVRVKRLFDCVDQRMAKDRYTESCAVAHVLLSLGEGDHALREQCNDILSSWSDAIAPQLHELPQRQQSHAAWFLINALEGAQILARACADGSPLKAASKACGGYFLTLQSD